MSRRGEIMCCRSRRASRDGKNAMEHIEQWKAIIHDDLTEARRRLTITPDASVPFLRDRIAEDEAILARLATMEGAVNMSEAA